MMINFIFFKKPYINTQKFKINKIYCKVFLKIFLIHFIFSICWTPIYFFINSLIKRKYFLNINQDFNLKSNLNYQNSIVEYLLITILIAPLIEELICRLPLNPKKIYFTISTLLITYIFFGGKYLSLDFFYYENITNIILFVIANVGLFFLLKQSHLDYIKQNIYTLYFYFFVLLFWLMHLKNFTVFHKEVFFIYPIYILPQLINGLLISYLRNNLHFLWGLIFHITMNSVGFLLTYLALR